MARKRVKTTKYEIIQVVLEYSKLHITPLCIWRMIDERILL